MKINAINTFSNIYAVKNTAYNRKNKNMAAANSCPNFQGLAGLLRLSAEAVTGSGAAVGLLLFEVGNAIQDKVEGKVVGWVEHLTFHPSGLDYASAKFNIFDGCGYNRRTHSCLIGMSYRESRFALFGCFRIFCFEVQNFLIFRKKDFCKIKFRYTIGIFRCYKFMKGLSRWCLK